MDPVLRFTLELAVIVVIAKAAGYVSIRLGQPAVLGKLVVGLILGPTVLDMLHWPVFRDPNLEESLLHLAHLGVLFLMFVAGLEVDLRAMLQVGRPAVAAGVLGVMAPVGLGLAVSLPFGFGLERGLFMGLVLAATSVSISAQTLMELDVLRTPVGITLLGAAVVDDVLVILLLSLFTALTGGGVGGSGGVAVLIVVLRMIGYLALAAVVGFWAIPWLSRRVSRLPISEGILSLAFVVTLLLAWSAEVVGGMAAITGAFLSGLFFGRTPLRRTIESKVHTLTYAWLVPIFFVSIGLEANARALGWAGLPFAILLVVVAMISKLVGSGGGARLAGFGNRDSLRLGVGMASRGEVGLIVATVGLTSGLIGDEIFASIVLVVLATTLVTPLWLRRLYRDKEARVESSAGSENGSEETP
jgi:Kef-type K+ transport system membrane component KefB